MNKPNFGVRISNYEQVNEIKGAWTIADYQKLLVEMDCPAEETSSMDENRELCLMCLQDRPNVEAAGIVLKHRIGDRLTAGQMKNAAVELADEKLWEQFADLSLHEELFHVSSLMFSAFPGDYYEPDAIQLAIEIDAGNELAREIAGRPLEESFIVRLLADGMHKESILHRLFEDQLASNSFPEASSIVWIIGSPLSDGNTLSVDITSSAHWLDSLKGVDEYESHATPDASSVTR